MSHANGTFQAAFIKALDEAGTNPYALARVIGISHRTTTNWKKGENIPMLSAAVKASEALGAPYLLEALRHERERCCARCGLRFVPEDRGYKARFCSEGCQAADWAGRLKAGRQRQNAIIREENARLRDAIYFMCSGCEPGGVCRQADCALRPVSPFPLVKLQQRPA